MNYSIYALKTRTRSDCTYELLPYRRPPLLFLPVFFSPEGAVYWVSKRKKEKITDETHKEADSTRKTRGV